MDQLAKNIEQFICESNKYFYNNELQSAIANAEKAYSLSKNCETCPEITRKKIEFNLACLYCNSSSLEERFKSKAYLDLIQKSTLIFVRKHEVALLYSKLGGQFNSDIDLRIDCYKSAAENFAKSKDWQKFCDVELIHAQLLNNQSKFKESEQIANKIQRACLYIKDKQKLAKIHCDLSTIFASDVNNESKIKRAKKLLKQALKLMKSNESDEDLCDLELCIYQNLASVNNQLNYFHKAIELVFKSYQLITESDLTNSKFFILSDLKFSEGYAYAKLNNYDQAIAAYLESHNYAKKTNQKNVWESLEELGQLYKLHNDYQKSYYYFDKSLKYLFYLNDNKKKKNHKLNSTNKTLNENRLKVKKNLVLKILNETNQEIIESTNLLDNETTLVVDSSLANINETTINETKTQEKEEIKYEKNLSDEIESNLNTTTTSTHVMPLESNENVDTNLNSHEIVNTNHTISPVELSDTQQIQSMYKELLQTQNQSDTLVINNQPVSTTTTNDTINDTNSDMKNKNESRESINNSSPNTFTIYRGNSLKTTYKGGTKSYKSFNEGSIRNHPEIKNKKNPTIDDLSDSSQTEKENSKICVIS